MSIVGKVRGTALTALRGASGATLRSTVVANEFLGKKGAKDYVELADLSETLDPIANVEPLLEIRDRVDFEGISVGYPDRIASNNRIYGIKRSIFGDEPLGPESPAVEHGLFLGNFVIPEDTVQTAAPAVVTFGDYRQKTIRARQNLPVFKVGAYTRYATPHYSVDRIAREKAELGRTLLVFLSHTTPDSSHGEHLGDRLGWLDEFAAGFDSVLVSVYWWNLADPEVSHLRSRGYRIVSCGLMHDRNFLSRLKTLLLLADEAVGDNIGTHVGYLLDQGVPFRLFGGVPVVLLPEARTANDRKFGVRAVDPAILASLEQTFDVEAGLSIAEARNIASPLWGFEYERSRAELAAIADIARDVVAVSGGRTKRYGAAARELLSTYQATNETKHALLSEALGGSH